MLSEATALALLERHCGPLRIALWANVAFRPRADWKHSACDRVDLVVVAKTTKPSATLTSRDVGAQLRLALGVAQAVSCCRGFEPATNQAFWRRAAATLWIGPVDSPPTHMSRFTATTFAHVGLRWGGDDRFWVGFLHGTHACDALMASVLSTLGPCLEGGSLPPLRVSLSNCWANADGYAPRDNLWGCWIEGQRVVRTQALKGILRAAHSTRPDAMHTDPMATQLGLVVEYLVDDSRESTLDTLNLLAQVRIPTHGYLECTIHRLTVQLTPPVAPTSARPSDENRRAVVMRGRTLGILLRTLVVNNGRSAPLVHTVELRGSSYSDFRLVGAALSAFALASPPIEELRCRDLFDAWRSKEQLLRLAWLAYALHRRQGPPLALSLSAAGTFMSKKQSEYIEQLMAGGTPLRDVVGEALRLRLGGDDDKVALLDVDCAPHGSTVWLARGTRLHVEPMRIHDETVVVTLGASAGSDGDSGSEEVDLVAHVTYKGGYVGVVYGGYGLLWADAACVVDWQWFDGDFAMRDGDEDPRGSRYTGGREWAVSSLALGFEQAVKKLPFERCPRIHRAYTMFQLFSRETLETLTLDRVVIAQNDLIQLLESFLRLETLHLDRCVVESLAPLADSYRRPASMPRRARIAVLSLLGARDWSMRDQMLPTTTLKDKDLLRPRLWKERTDRAAVWLAPLLDVLVGGNAGGVLRELHVDLTGMSEADQYAAVRRLARAVSASSTWVLKRLHVACRWPVVVACATQLGPLRDAVLHDPPRVRCAVLSVLRVFGCGAPEIAQTVLEWTGGNVVRTVTWSGS